MTGMRNGYVYTGREMVRWLCESCKARFAVGRPVAQDSWPAKLSIPVQQIDLLLVAAAEYRDLCIEAGEPQEAVAFVDWVRPDALTTSYVSPVNVATMERGTYSEKRR